MSRYQAPEVKIARRILKKHSIVPPVDVETLIKSYANLVYRSIPVAGVDGIAVNIKVPHKKPLVVINSEIPVTRQRFTMAHELGHLVIPWHVGIDFDETDQSFENQQFQQMEYSFIEAEANAFAAELLMPSDYLQIVANESIDLSAAHKRICRELMVSPAAAAIQMGKTLSPGIIYCVVSNGLVQYSGKTDATPLSPPVWGEAFKTYNYPLSKLSQWQAGGNEYYWWEINSRISASPTMDERDWKTIQNSMLTDLFPSSHITKYKYRINGIIGSANSKLKGTPNYTLESLLGYCYQRFDDDEFYAFKRHKDFKVLLQKRFEDILAKE